jgi:hypothetical protein
LYEDKALVPQGNNGVAVLGDDDVPLDLDKSNLNAEPLQAAVADASPVLPLAMIIEENDVDGDLATDIIDECLSGNQIVEL